MMNFILHGVLVWSNVSDHCYLCHHIIIGATGRTDTRRINVDRKLTFFTVRHEIHRLVRLYSLVNQDMSHAPLAIEYVYFISHQV